MRLLCRGESIPEHPSVSTTIDSLRKFYTIQNYTRTANSFLPWTHTCCCFCYSRHYQKCFRTMALTFTPREHSLTKVPLTKVLAPHERFLTKVPLMKIPLGNVPSRTFPHKGSPRECSLTKVSLANVPLVKVPHEPFFPSPFANISSQTFSRLWRLLALPHSSACGRNNNAQHDKAQQMTAMLHHTVKQSYLTMSINAHQLSRSTDAASHAHN